MLTVLEDRLQKSDNQTTRQDETTSNRKQLLAASGATPIGSTAVPPMIKSYRHESTHQPGDAVESTSLVFNRHIKPAKVWRTKFSRLGLRSNSTRRLRTGRTRNYTCTQGSRSRR